MVDEKLSNRLIAALPGLAVLGLGLAIVHAFGFLAPFDRDWLTWLTVSDLVTLTWAMLPVAGIGMAYGLLWRNTENSEQKLKRQAQEAKFDVSIWALALNILGYFLLIGPPALAIINLPWLLALDRFLFLLVTGHIWAVVRLPLLFVRSPNFSTIAITSFAYFFVIAALTTGYFRAEQIKSTDQLGRVTLSSGKILCQRIIYSGERGLLLYDRIHEETTAIPAAEVAVITRTKNCWRVP